MTIITPLPTPPSRDDPTTFNSRADAFRAYCTTGEGAPAFAKLKAMLRKASERTVIGLWAAIGRIIDTFTPAECNNYFAAAG